MVRRPVPRLVVAAAAACSLFLGVVFSPPAARGATPEEISASIKKGQEFLLKQQKAPGRWEPDEKRQGEGHTWEKFQGAAWGGYTSIATYALLASGKSPQDKDLAKAIEFLKKADIVGPYALGMRAQVWAYLPQNAEAKKLYRNDLKRLTKTLNIKGPGNGLWDYDDPSRHGARIDHSISQYGVLGVWACAQGGAEVGTDVWLGFDKIWKKHQYKNGGWSYDGNGSDDKPVTHTMTAAGIATLFITQDYLRATDGLNCSGNVSNDHIERGLKWLGDNFGGVANNNYLWYGIERIGAASGRKYFGDKDWYQLGAENVVRTQLPDGSWKSNFPGNQPVQDTAFALLFLSRGRAPIVMNKLDHSDAAAEPGGKTVGNWNQRPRDVANVTKWIGKQGERYLSWQVVNLKVNAQDLLDAPILYISGAEPLQIDDAEAATLRQFVEDGGLILGNADCAKEGFADSFRKLGTRLLPEYEFRELPASHTIFVGQQFKSGNWKEQVSLQGISNGSRELMLLIPEADAGRYWQQRADRTKEHLFQLASNIYLYSVGKKMDRVKGETHLVKDKGVAPEHQVKVARIEVGSNWDPEPGGWRRLALVMKNEHKVGVTTEVVKLGDGKLSSAGAKLAHLTGTAAFVLNTEQKKELKEFVEAGGTLVIDATGGSTAFAESAEQQVVDVFGERVAKHLNATVSIKHALFANPAAAIPRVFYRRTAMEKLTGNLKVPRLKAIEIDGRLAVIMSREDLSTGLVGHAVDGVIGYEPVSATAIMRNVILYGMTGGKVAPSTQPSTTQPSTQPSTKPAGPAIAGTKPGEPAPKGAAAKPAPNAKRVVAEGDGLDDSPAPAAAQAAPARPRPAPKKPAPTEGDGLD